MDLIILRKILKLDANMILIQLRTIPSLKKEFQLGLTEEIAEDINKSREEDNLFGRPRLNGMQSQVEQLILEANLFLLVQKHLKIVIIRLGKICFLYI